MADSETELLYRICPEEEWAEAQEKGALFGGDLDKRSGFIHLSKLSQVEGVLAFFYAGREDLNLLTIDAEKLGDGLKYDEVETGVFFPHFYGPMGTYAPLNLSAVLSSKKLKVENGMHVLE